MSIMESRHAVAARGRCPCCRRQMLAAVPGRSPTRDHILPQAWGTAPPEGRTRVLCADCNGLRGAAGHCLGALACARAVAMDTHPGRWLTTGARRVLRGWR